jgi:hypothetical protein
VWSNLIPITSEKLQIELKGPHYTELDNFEIEIPVLNSSNSWCLLNM